MGYHFWDMDHTLVACDCEVSWKRYLVDEGLTDPGDRELADRFFHGYATGNLDAEGYLAFQLKDFAGRPVAAMAELALHHFQRRVASQVYPEALALIHRQREAGDLVCLLTATSRPIAQPLADHCGIPEVLATEFEVADGRYTGRLLGGYCLGAGKRERLRRYCAGAGIPMEEVHYYGDSLADLEVLPHVGHPVAVNPIDGLRREAEARGWPILDFQVP